MAGDYYATAQAYQTKYSQMARQAILAGETPGRATYKWAYASAFYYLKALAHDLDPSAIRNDKEQTILELYQKLKQDDVKYYRQKLPAIVVMQDLYDRFQFKIDEIDAEFNKQVHKAVDYVERQAKAAKQFVSDRADDMKQFATNRVNDVKQFTTNRVNDVKQFATDRVNDVKQFATDRVNDAKAGLKALFRPVTEALTDIKANVDSVRRQHRLDREQAARTAEDWLKTVQTVADMAKDQAPIPLSGEEKAKRKVNETEGILNDMQQMVFDLQGEAKEPGKDVAEPVEEQVTAEQVIEEQPVEEKKVAKKGEEEVEAIFSKKPMTKEDHREFQRETWEGIQHHNDVISSLDDKDVSYENLKDAYILARNTLWTFAQDTLPKDVWEKAFPGFSQYDLPGTAKVSISTLAFVLKENTDLFLLSPNTVSRLSMIEGYERDILKNNLPWNAKNPFVFPEVGKGQTCVPAITKQNAVLLAKDLQDVMSACALTRDMTPEKMNDEDFKRAMFKKYVLDNQVLGFPDMAERDRTEEKTEVGPAMEKTNDTVMEENYGEEDYGR